MTDDEWAAIEIPYRLAIAGIRIYPVLHTDRSMPTTFYRVWGVYRHDEEVTWCRTLAEAELVAADLAFAYGDRTERCALTIATTASTVNADGR